MYTPERKLNNMKKKVLFVVPAVVLGMVLSGCFGSKKPSSSNNSSSTHTSTSSSSGNNSSSSNPTSTSSGGNESSSTSASEVPPTSTSEVPPEEYRYWIAGSFNEWSMTAVPLETYPSDDPNVKEQYAIEDLALEAGDEFRINDGDVTWFGYDIAEHHKSIRDSGEPYHNIVATMTADYDVYFKVYMDGTFGIYAAAPLPDPVAVEYTVTGVPTDWTDEFDYFAWAWGGTAGAGKAYAATLSEGSIKVTLMDDADGFLLLKVTKDVTWAGDWDSEDIKGKSSDYVITGETTTFPFDGEVPPVVTTDWYVTGTFNDWAKDTAVTLLPLDSSDTNIKEQYAVEDLELELGDEFKVTNYTDGGWYGYEKAEAHASIEDGGDPDHNIKATLTGKYDIYFKIYQDETVGIAVIGDDGTVHEQVTYTVNELPADWDDTCDYFAWAWGGSLGSGKVHEATLAENAITVSLTDDATAFLLVRVTKDVVWDGNFDSVDVLAKSRDFEVTGAEATLPFEEPEVPPVESVYTLEMGGEPITMVDATDLKEEGDEWVAQVKAEHLVLTADDTLVFKKDGERIYPGASGYDKGNNAVYHEAEDENPSYLTVRQSADDAKAYLKIYEEGYDLWLGGYEEEAPEWYLAGTFNDANWEKENAILLTLNNEGKPENVKEQYAALQVELKAGDEFKITDFTESGWYGYSVAEAHASIEEGEDGNIKATLTGKYDIYFKINNDDTFSIYAAGAAEVIPPEPGEKVTYTCTDLPDWIGNNEAVLFAWVWSNDTDGAWHEVTLTGTTATFELDAEAANFLLARCYPGTTTPDWDATTDAAGKIWNKKKDQACTAGVHSYSLPAAQWVQA